MSVSFTETNNKSEPKYSEVVFVNPDAFRHIAIKLFLMADVEKKTSRRVSSYAEISRMIDAGEYYPDSRIIEVLE